MDFDRVPDVSLFFRRIYAERSILGEYPQGFMVVVEYKQLVKV